MRGVTTSEEIIKKIKYFRQTGYSLSEISQKVSKSKSLVSKYVKGVKALPEYRSVLLEKQGGSKTRAERHWKSSNEKAKEIIGSLSKRDMILVLASLYWGEGTKAELNIINSDPFMLRTFIECIQEIGVDKKDIKATLRIYGDISKEEAIIYWSKILNLSKEHFLNVNVLNGKKQGKLKYGMCRLRVKKSAEYFKLLISIINHIKFSFMLP